jgi:hypothetical protein
MGPWRDSRCSWESFCVSLAAGVWDARVLVATFMRCIRAFGSPDQLIFDSMEREHFVTDGEAWCASCRAAKRMTADQDTECRVRDRPARERFCHCHECGHIGEVIDSGPSRCSACGAQLPIIGDEHEREADFLQEHAAQRLLESPLLPDRKAYLLELAGGRSPRAAFDQAAVMLRNRLVAADCVLRVDREVRERRLHTLAYSPAARLILPGLMVTGRLLAKSMPGASGEMLEMWSEVILPIALADIGVLPVVFP